MSLSPAVEVAVVPLELRVRVVLVAAEPELPVLTQMAVQV
jgi:hypothetical protein